MYRPIRLAFAAALAALVLAPLAARAQENSIMQSFHPEKVPAKDTAAAKDTPPAAEQGRATGTAAPKDEKAMPQADAK